MDLISDPKVDVVTVAVSVPAHRDLIVAALTAGKQVLTEWPVGVDTAPTEQVVAVAARTGLRTAVGLQARANPAAFHAAGPVAAGAVGRVLTARCPRPPPGSGAPSARASCTWKTPRPR